MDVDKKDAVAMPTVSPTEELEKTDLWDTETTHIQVVSHDIQRQNALPESATTGEEDTQSLLIAGSDSRSASVSRRIVMRSNKTVTDEAVSPELAELILHRERIASQETELLQAVTLPNRQETGETSSVAKTTQLDAKQKRTIRRRFYRKSR